MPDTTQPDNGTQPDAAAPADTGADLVVPTGDGTPETTPDASKPSVNAGGPPEDIEELKRGYLRHADYTRKTQELAEERRLLARLMSEADGRPAPVAPAQPPAELTPDALMAKKPAEFGAWLLQDRKVMQDELAQLKALVMELAPVASRERVVKTFHSMAQDDPRIADAGVRSEVARLLDQDPDLQELAESNPKKALAIAVRTAEVSIRERKLTAELAAMKKTQAARTAAAPPPTSSGPATMAKYLSPLEAAERAFKEEGLSIQ